MKENQSLQVQMQDMMLTHDGSVSEDMFEFLLNDLCYRRILFGYHGIGAHYYDAVAWLIKASNSIIFTVLNIKTIHFKLTNRQPYIS